MGGLLRKKGGKKSVAAVRALIPNSYSKRKGRDAREIGAIKEGRGEKEVCAGRV